MGAESSVIRISKNGDNYDVFKDGKLIMRCPNIVIASAVADRIFSAFAKVERKQGE